jgi:hypothetical protein
MHTNRSIYPLSVTARDEKLMCGLAYAWGYEDASGKRTAPSPDAPDGVGCIAFAEAFADAYEDFWAERRFNMTSVQNAYAQWQASGGKGIWRAGEATADIQARREATPWERI